MPPHLSRLHSVGRGSDSANREVSVATYHTTKETAPQQHEQSFARPNMVLEELKAKRDQERIMARELCSNAKETLVLNVSTTGVHAMLKSFLRDLQRTEVVLRQLNDKIAQFIHTDCLNEKFTTNIEYEDQMIDIMRRLYHRLKDSNADTREHCKVMKTLNGLANLTVLCCN